MAGLGGEAEMLLATLLEEGISEAVDSPESTMAWPTDLMHETLAPDSTTVIGCPTGADGLRDPRHGIPHPCGGPCAR